MIETKIQNILTLLFSFRKWLKQKFKIFKKTICADNG